MSLPAAAGTPLPELITEALPELLPPVPPAHRPEPDGLSVLVTTVSSDSHTWNLVFLQLALEEHGHRVRNLGPCVPAEDVVAAALRSRPDLIVVSTVNGHGQRDGSQLIARIRACPELADLPVVIGGKLGIAGPTGRQSRSALHAAGFDAVFEDGADATALGSLSALVRARQLR